MGFLNLPHGKTSWIIFKILKELKSNSLTSEIPVVLDSIVDDYREEGLRLGAVDYLSKPLDMETLYEVVNKVLSMEKFFKEYGFYPG